MSSSLGKDAEEALKSMDQPTGSTQIKKHRSRQEKTVWLAGGILFLAAILYLMITADGGVADPTELSGKPSHATVVFNSSIIVFREGLEAVLIFAAVVGSFIGANRAKRRPVVLGALAAFFASIVTWFIAQAILDPFRQYGDKLQAVTGLIAVLVLLVILNWFLHRVYWTSWISRHHRKRREVLARDSKGFLSGQIVGLVALGFTSVYREGFEIVLFLQSIQLESGTSAVLEGVSIGLFATTLVGIATFVLHRKLPYRKMLVVTGVMIGFVLVVMIGGTARTFQDIGWLPTTSIGVNFPGWWAAWFEVVPTVETLTVQGLAALLVIGSYYAAEYLRVRRPRRQGKPVAMVASQPPPVVTSDSASAI